MAVVHRGSRSPCQRARTPAPHDLRSAANQCFNRLVSIAPLPAAARAEKYGANSSKLVPRLAGEDAHVALLMGAAGGGGCQATSRHHTRCRSVANPARRIMHRLPLAASALLLGPHC